MQHLNPSKVNEQSDMIGIQPREPPLTCEVFHNDPHHGCIPLKQMCERKYGFIVLFVSGLKVWLIVAHV